MHRQDVRVAELRRDLDLTEEALRADRRGELGSHHLDRDLPPMLEILREIDGGHSARANDALDAVTVRERGLHLREACVSGHHDRAGREGTGDIDGRRT